MDFRYTQSDLLLGAWEYHFTRRWPVVVGLVGALAGILGVALLPELTWTYASLAAVSAMLASGALTVLATWGVVVRTHPQRKSMHAEFGPDGLIFAEPTGSPNIAWTHFKRARMTRHFLCVAPPRGVSLIPLRLFTPDQQTRIRSWVAPLLARP